MTFVGSGICELKNPILFSFLSTNHMFPLESDVRVCVNVLSVGILNSDIEFVRGDILISLSARNCVVHILPSLSLIIWYVPAVSVPVAYSVISFVFGLSFLIFFSDAFVKKLLLI